MNKSDQRDSLAPPLFPVRTGTIVLVSNGEVGITPDLTPDYYNLSVLERPMGRSERRSALRVSERQMDAVVEAYQKFKEQKGDGEA